MSNSKEGLDAIKKTLVKDKIRKVLSLWDEKQEYYSSRHLEETYYDGFIDALADELDLI